MDKKKEKKKDKTIFKKMEKKIYFRFAGIDDSDYLLKWRNDKITRKFSFNPEEITKEEHERWFKATLSNKKRNIFIVIGENGERMGQIRLDWDDNNVAEISIAIAPDFRGRGIGTDVLTRGSRLVMDNFEADYIIAKIKKENIISIKVFEKSGFSFYKTHSDHLEYRYK